MEAQCDRCVVRKESELEKEEEGLIYKDSGSSARRPPEQTPGKTVF